MRKKIFSNYWFPRMIVECIHVIFSKLSHVPSSNCHSNQATIQLLSPFIDFVYCFLSHAREVDEKSSILSHPKAYQTQLFTGMLGSSLASTFVTFDFATRSRFSLDLESFSPDSLSPNANFAYGCLHGENKGGALTTKIIASTKWRMHSAGKATDIVLSMEERKTWEACRQALSGLEFNVDEEDKILGKAFGLVHSPYWGEEREKVVPKFEVVTAVLDYLRGLSLSDDDLQKLLKKFPEVLGCSLENELKVNIEILENKWGIKGKSLRNLLLRNPKVLGYNVDCKGDCMAQCTRCWVRF